MISNITTILYVLSVSDEIINNGTLQKGTAVSRVDAYEGLQIYKYTNYLTSTNQTNSDSSDDIATISFEKDNMYLITGKFCIFQDDSINVTIISSVHVSLDKEDMPIMKPTVHFVGKTMNQAQLTDVGYTLQIQVKPYLSKEQFNPFLINLTHPVNGRFKNALIKATKNSTVHCTGLFFLANKEIFCEILEFQFILGKVESDNTVKMMKHQQIFQLEREIQRKNKLIKLALIIENYILLCTHFFIRISLYFLYLVFFFY